MNSIGKQNYCRASAPLAGPLKSAGAAPALQNGWPEIEFIE